MRARARSERARTQPLSCVSRERFRPPRYVFSLPGIEPAAVETYKGTKIYLYAPAAAAPPIASGGPPPAVAPAESAESASAAPAPAAFIDKLALVLVRDRKQLVARSRGKAAFFTPGGKREPGESDEAALVRECKEELTVDLRVATIAPYGVFEAQAHGKPAGTVVRMTCYTADFDGTLAPSEEVEELRWIGSDCPRAELSATGAMILDDLKARGLID